MSSQKIRESDIAIIGMSCRFPGAENVDAFWRNLRDGVESITFFTDSEIQQNDPELLGNPNYVKAGAVLPNIDQFDASFFGYSPKEAAIMDPQQRLYLECAWEALENAGYNPDIYRGLIAVYAGSSLSTYLANNVSQAYLADNAFIEADMLQFQIKQGNDRNYLPTRLSYKLNLRGPSVNVQTACSTALVAVHLACQSLLNGECDMALAGGVSLIVPDKGGYLYEEGMIRSPDGHCRAFDAQAAGTLFGNGAGIVLLKLLSEAISDGDQIVAVIKGGAINNDGALKVGFTAPSIERQADVIEEALAVAEVDASTITYIEAHGTGTKLGDPIEVAALTQAFSHSSQEDLYREQCAIGSVKTNIGHLDEAAGIAGLIKTALALKHKQIPPSLHFQLPNPQIDFENSPFYVNTELTEWLPYGVPRRAGVSSFGMGGTNCHLVLEEAPVGEGRGGEGARGRRGEGAKERDRHLLTLSAKTPQALEQLVERYVDYLASSAAQEAGLANICFTANTGRKHFTHRAAFVVESNEQLREQLARFLDSGAHGQEVRLPSPNVGGGLRQGGGRIAFLFTGQGSQYVDMGRQLYESQPIFRQTIDRCDEILRPYLDRSLLSVLYPTNEPTNQRTNELNETAYTQPALFAVEYALYQVWKSWGVEPFAVIGHSVGEYVAACVAGVFSLEDGLKLIAERGRLMQALPRDGSMVSVMASEGRVADLIWSYEGQVAIAAINGPQSVVISGQKETIDEICTTLEAEGIKIKRLNVSHAFHSPLMTPMLDSFSQVAQQVTYSEPRIKLISNVTGQLASQEATTADYWVRHVRQPVRFAQGYESLERLGANVFIEIGPKPVLLGMGRNCLPEQRGLWLPSLRPKQGDWQYPSFGRSEVGQILTSLREVYLAGVTVDWVGYDSGYARRRVPLPTYPWQRERHWIEPKERIVNRTQSQLNHPLIGQHLQLAGTQEIFHTQISPSRLSWLSDHRVFDTIVMPGTGYLEMALAAGAAVTKSEQLLLTDVIIQQAMTFGDTQASQTIQIVLTPNLDQLATSTLTGAKFEIFSLTAPSTGTSGKPVWTLHASGQLVEQEPTSQWVDLAALQAECKQPVSLEALSERFKKHHIDYGPSFHVVKEVWLGDEGSALGQISLSTADAREAKSYQFHPVLLDGALQVFDAALLDNPDSYMPVGFERLYLMARTPVNLDIWCHVQLRKAPEADTHPADRAPQVHLMADLRLIRANGDLIAMMEGVRLKLSSRQAMLRTQDSSQRDAFAVSADWLYQVAWRPQWRFGLLPNYLPTLDKTYPEACPDAGRKRGLRDSLETRLAELIIEADLATYGSAFSQLESLSLAYIVAAFQQMGWLFELGERFSTAQKASELEIVAQHRQLFVRLLDILAEANILKSQGLQSSSMERWQVISIPELIDPQEILRNRAKGAEAEIELVSRCGAKLAEVLQGSSDPIQLLFPAGDTTTLSKLYRDAPVLGVTNTLVQEALLSALEQLPPGRGWRILEIGAGTGGTTAYLLPHLPADRTEYLFTDISAFFIAKAEERFKAYPFVRYQVLDIQQAPQAQGFDPHQYDLIVAADVLHATSDLRQTLTHVRQLLAPGGMLILMEDSEPARWADLTFGLTEGWWKFTDRELRPNHPLLSPDKWQSLLEEMGFSQTTALWPQIAGPHKLPREAVIVARTSLVRQVAKRRKWLILADEEIGWQVAERLREEGDDCTLLLPGEKHIQIASPQGWDSQTYTINPANPRDFKQFLATQPDFSGVLFCWAADMKMDDLETATLLSCGSTLHLVQALVAEYATKLPRLWLVTQGAQAVGALGADSKQHHVQNVAGSTLWGMGKVIALEYPDLQVVRVDLDPAGTDNISLLVDEMLSLPAGRGRKQSAADSLLEDEVAYRNGVRYVSRLVPLKRRSGLNVPQNQPFRLSIAERGTPDNLQLEPITRLAPGAGEIEMKVHAAGLNFIDVLNSMGLLASTPPFGIESVGEIVAVGEGVTNFSVGDRVIAVAPGSFSEYVTVDVNLVAPMPTTLSFSEAATIPEVFLTTYWCLHHLAKISAGDRVLIHAATGGIGQAAIQWAQAAGAEVFGTASQSKWPQLSALGVKHIYNSRTLDFADEIRAVTNGEGVDIVLNSLTGEGFIEKSLSVLSNGGRFIELAKRDIWSESKVARLRPDVAYFVVDMEQEIEQQRELIQTMLRQVVKKFSTGLLKPLSATLFPIQDAVRAFRYMQQAKHTGKIVLTFAKRGSEGDGELTLRADGRYLITGGYGGLGLQVARLFIKHGAKHLVLVGRSEPKPAALLAISELERAGAIVSVVQADVSDKAAVAQALAKASIGSTENGLSWRGVVHAAGVLDDGLLLQQTYERFVKVMAPKVQGAWNLHTLMENEPLDFFVLFSSATSLLGNAGQANHAAANAYLDALASYRRHLGLPSLSINWGTWSEVGIAARLGLDKLSRKQGEETIAPRQGLHILEQLLQDKEAAHQVGVMPIDWPQFLSRQLTSPPFFSDLSLTLPSSKSSLMTTQTSAGGHHIREQLENAPAKEAKSLLQAHVRELIAQVLGVNVSTLLEEREVGFFTLGMDSLTSIELRNRLQTSLGCPLPATLLFDYPTQQALMDYLAGELLEMPEQAPEPEADNRVSSTSRMTYSTAVPLQQQGTKLPFFCVSSVLGMVFELQPLANSLDRERPFYALRSTGLEEGEPIYNRVADMAANHIRSIQRIQPQGPYLLGGYSIGGLVAFEIAQQLQRQGHTVPLLVIIDTDIAAHKLDKYGFPWSEARYMSNFIHILRSATQEDGNLSAQKLDDQLEDLDDLTSYLNRLGLSWNRNEIRRMFQVFKENARNISDYMPPMNVPVPISIFRAQESGALDTLPDEVETKADPFWGWDQRSSNEVELTIVPGNHFTMVNKPHVTVLAEELRVQIDKALAEVHQSA